MLFFFVKGTLKGMTDLTVVNAEICPQTRCVGNIAADNRGGMGGGGPEVGIGGFYLVFLLFPLGTIKGLAELGERKYWVSLGKLVS